jgi:hypothetical protein
VPASRNSVDLYDNTGPRDNVETGPSSERGRDRRGRPTRVAEVIRVSRPAADGGARLTVAQRLVKLPVIPAPAGFRFQPIDAAEVAARLAELALDRPTGLVPDMGGPRAYGVAELLRGYLRATHRYRPIVPVWLPDAAVRAFRAGANPVPRASRGSPDVGSLPGRAGLG